MPSHLYIDFERKISQNRFGKHFILHLFVYIYVQLLFFIIFSAAANAIMSQEIRKQHKEKEKQWKNKSF